MANVAGRPNAPRTRSESLEADVLANEHFYEQIEQGPEFQQLEKSKRSFIIPATIFFVVYYFALPILVGYFPDAMNTRVLGNVSIAYLFALSQFFMAWILAFLYVRKASSVFDPLVARIVEMATKLRRQKGV